MTDTSTDAVKALAGDHQKVGDNPDKYIMGHPHHWKTAEVLLALLAERDDLRAKLDAAVELLHRAKEELCMIRMKDTGAVYDILLRIEIDAALAKIKGADHE